MFSSSGTKFAAMSSTRSLVCQSGDLETEFRLSVQCSAVGAAKNAQSQPTPLHSEIGCRGQSDSYHEVQQCPSSDRFDDEVL